MRSSAYRPFAPAARPGGRPAERPRYRVLVHRQYEAEWRDLPARVGLESAQQFYDFVAATPGSPPPIGAASILQGRAGRPIYPGCSRTVHYEISGAGRINYQFHDAYTGGAHGDPHPVVFILTIRFTSH
jgi:hypothetical protein